MIRPGLVALLLVSLPLSAQEWRQRKLEALSMRRAAAPKLAATGDKPITVDCARKDRIQQAIDQNPGGTVIEIRGLCIENVRIDHKEVTLRGANPATDGIRSLTTTPALTITDSDNVVIEHLSLSDNPGTAIQMSESSVLLEDCVINGNNAEAAGGLSAIHATSHTFVRAGHLTVSNNQRRGVTVQRSASFFCVGCDFANNTGVAAAANDGVLALLRSTVTGRNGILASGGSAYADIDCITDPDPHPCSMQVTGRAIQAFDRAVAALYGAGDFTGAVLGSDSATVWVYGARQLAAGQPGHGPSFNNVDINAKLIAATAFESSPPLTSRVLNTQASTFARVLLMNDTELAGTLQCGSAADAWLDPEVVAGPGAAVNGCEHGTL